MYNWFKAIADFRYGLDSYVDQEPAFMTRRKCIWYGIENFMFYIKIVVIVTKI